MNRSNLQSNKQGCSHNSIVSETYTDELIKYIHTCCERNEPVFLFINVQPEGVDAQEQFGTLLVTDVEVIDSVHLQVLGDFQILHHRILTEHSPVLVPPRHDALFPFGLGHFVLLQNSAWKIKKLSTCSQVTHNNGEGRYTQIVDDVPRTVSIVTEFEFHSS